MIREQGNISQQLTSQTALTASNTVDGTYLNDDFDGIVFELNVSSVSVTGGTLDVYIQTDIGGTYYDVAHFVQIAASSADSYFASVSIHKSLYVGTTAKTGTLAASSVAGLPPMRRAFRVKNVVATAAFTFVVNAYFNHQNK